jgi:hypothetical protein
MREKTKSKKSRARPGFIREGWKVRVNAAFANYWHSLKKNRALPKSKDQKRADRQFEAWFREFSASSRAYDKAREQIEVPVGPRIQSTILSRLDIEGPPITPLARSGEEATFHPENPESSPIFRKLVFLKYGITFRELIHQIDIDKNPTAHRKLMAVHRDFWRVQLGHGFHDFKLKFSMDHFDVITHGFDFGFEKLTPDELAECLDEICPCGQKHSPEYLKKLRTNMRKACDRLGKCG